MSCREKLVETNWLHQNKNTKNSCIVWKSLATNLILGVSRVFCHILGSNREMYSISGLTRFARVEVDLRNLEISQKCAHEGFLTLRFDNLPSDDQQHLSGTLLLFL